MGKGNRTRNERAAATIAASTQKKTKQNKTMPTWVGTVIVVAVLVAIVLVATLSTLSSRGTFMRMKTAMESDNYKINAAMMSYIMYSEYQNITSSYEQYKLKISGGEGGKELDTSLPLRSQTYSVTKDAEGNTVVTTWFDYFMNIAVSDARQILIFCEYAKANGMALTEEEYGHIDESIANIKQYAALSGYTEASYLAANYGTGVSMKDVRAVMELSELAAKFSTTKTEEFTDAVTDIRIDEYYQSHKDTYDKYIDYLGYTFTATFEPLDAEDEPDDALRAEKNAALLAEYEAKKETFRSRIEYLVTITDQDAFKAKLEEYVRADLEAERDAETTDEDFEKEVTKALEKIVVKEYAKGTTSGDLNKWLFATEEGDEARKVGDTKHLKSEQDGSTTEGENVTYAKAESTYSAYYVTREVHHDNGDTVRNVGHILLKSDTFKDLTSTDKLTGKVKEMADRVLARDGKVTAEAMAKELLATMYNDGKITKVGEGNDAYYTINPDDFEAYGVIYTEDGNVFYENVAKGQMVEEFEEWLFDEKRQLNEISYPGAVLTEDYGFHIMMYRGATQKWRHDIKELIVTEDYEAWYESIKDNFTIELNEKALKSIAG